MNDYACPICNYDKYDYHYYTEGMWGIVEQHGLCNRCGYRIEQNYCNPIDGFSEPLRKGYSGSKGIYHSKNIRKRLRIKRKYNIKYSNDDRFLNYI